MTVLARNAAAADVAATLIANSVDIDSPAVIRRPACALDPDNDLGDRPVTVDVGALGMADVEAALAAGRAAAQSMVDRGLIAAAALSLCGSNMTVAKMPAALLPVMEVIGAFSERRSEGA